MKSLVPPFVLAIVLAAASPLFAQRTVFEHPSPAPAANKVDEAVFAKLHALGLQEAALCSDAVFVRRVFLDTIGTLPTADEVQAFLDDQRADKRAALVDALLVRPEFADYWTMKWSEVLRLKSEFPVNLWPNAVQAYHRWLHTAIRDAMPYDQFARELLTANGSNFRVPQVNFYRALPGRDPNTIATSVALTFLGARTSAWPKERLDALAAFFAQVAYKPTGEWKEEIVYFDPDKGSAVAARTLTFPDGRAVQVKAGQDPRDVFAAWLVAPDNPYFAPAVVNRIWYWLLGRGIVHEPDDMRPDNAPVNPELLAYLSRELVSSRYDLRHVYRLILTSSTYQLSALPLRSEVRGPKSEVGGPKSEVDVAEANFAHAIVRPLDAEVLLDALCQVTGTTEEYASAIPEPYTFTPLDQRAIALADGSITSAFLETFGRPPRDSGLSSERNSGPTAAQRLYLLNSTDVQRRLQQSPRLQALFQAGGDGREVLSRLYRTILSRPPTPSEMVAVAAHVQATTNRRQAMLDLAWALINTAEFRLRH